MDKFDSIINETIQRYISYNVLNEVEYNGNEDDTKEKQHKKKKKKKFKKNAIKKKDGVRGDFDVEDDETYNQDVNDEEESSIKDILNNGFVNIKKVAEKLYPDHTPNGAQSQLDKKLKGAKSDSGSTYKLKKKEVKRLRKIIAADLNF